MDTIESLKQQLADVENEVMGLFKQQTDLEIELHKLLVEKYITPEVLQKSTWRFQGSTTLWAEDNKSLYADFDNMLPDYHSHIQIANDLYLSVADGDYYFSWDTFDMFQFIRQNGMIVNTKRFKLHIKELEKELQDEKTFLASIEGNY